MPGWLENQQHGNAEKHNKPTTTGERMSGLILKMIPGSVNLNGSGGGGPDLTPTDIAAALSYMKLTAFEERYLRARILQSEPWHRRSDLAYDAWGWALDIQIKAGWDIPKGQETYRKLAFIAIDQRINPEQCICPGCKGRGFYLSKTKKSYMRCSRCVGTRKDKVTGQVIGNGRRRISARRYAAALGISDKTFTEKWEPRLKMLTQLLIEIERKASYLIGVIEDDAEPV